MNGFIAFWTRNGVAANLLMVLIFVVGIAMFFRLEREVFPGAKFDEATISVAWPGASPREVEEQIILRIEEAISGLDNIKEVTAQAREGAANLRVVMLDGGDFDSFLNELKARVDGVSNLPQSSFPPVVRRVVNQEPLSWVSITGDPEVVTEIELNRLARLYRDQIAQIKDGSPLVEIQGYQEEEVAIEVTESALRQYGLTFDDVARAIRASSINQATGEVRTSTGNVPMAVRQLADTAEQFSQIVVRRNLDGSVVTIADVAVVRDGFAEQNFIYRINGLPGRTLQVMTPEKVNIVKIEKAVRKWVEEQQASLPEGVQMRQQFTLADMYYARMELVTSNAAGGLLLVVIVLFLFLRPVVAFWVAAGIFISFVGTFIFMPAAGVSLNMLSLFGLLIVTGILVDDALVVGESVHAQTERGREGVTAAIIGTQLVAKPVLFAVLTTMIAFTPFLFIGGGVSEFTKHIAWTVILALTFSLIESFMILPSHLAHLKPPKKTGFSRFQGRIADSLLWFADKIYRPMLQVTIASRYFVVTLFVMCFVLSCALVAQGWLKFKFFPDVEQNFIQMQVDMQRGTPFSRTEQVYEQINAAAEVLDADLRERNGKETLESFEVWAWPGGLFSFMIFTGADDRNETLAQIGDRFRDMIGEIPDAEDISISSSFTGDGGDRLAVSLQSSDLEQLTSAVADVKAYFGTQAILYDIGDSFEAAQDELRFTLKPGAERFGLSIGEVSRQVRQAYYGEEAQRLPRGGQDVRVMVRYPLEVRESLESLSAVRIRTPDGREIALDAVADVSYAPAVRRIDRKNRERSANVWSRVRAGSDAGPLREEFFSQVVPQIVAKYPDVTVERRGEDQEQAEFMSDLLLLYGLALFGMYMLIAIGFGSYWQPLLIMSAIPFGWMGAVFGHLIMGDDLAMFSLFGICAAGGVVVNDNIVFIDYINRLRKAGGGAIASLVEAGVVRFRPILLTTVTTFVGLFPILLEDSFDALFLRPLIVALAFGVLFALGVTLFFVPAMYCVGVDIARFYRGLWTGQKQPALGQGDSLHDLPDIDPHTT